MLAENGQPVSVIARGRLGEAVLLSLALTGHFDLRAVTF